MADGARTVYDTRADVTSITHAIQQKLEGDGVPIMFTALPCQSR